MRHGLDAGMKKWIATDFKHIMDHPALSAEAKAGYLLHVLRDGYDLERAPIADAYATLLEFVKEHMRADF